MKNKETRDNEVIISEVKPTRIPLESNDYERFISAKGNRKIDNRHVARLIRSIEINGNISTITCRDIVIGGKKYFEILDGQHRFEALKNLCEPIILDLWTNVKNKGMIALNENSKNWKLEDYLYYGIEDGILDYIYINKLKEESGLGLGTLIELFSPEHRNITGERGRITRNDVFKSLSWRIYDKVPCEKIYNQLLDFYKRFNIKIYTHIRFVQAFTTMARHPQYNHKKMLELMAKNLNLIIRQYSKSEYIQIFETIYNSEIINESDHIIFYKNPVEDM